MAKPKRKPKPSHAPKAKKKVNKIKHLKKKASPRAKPAAKKVKLAKKPLKKVLAKAAVAPQPKATAGKLATKAGAKPEDKKGKPAIKSAKAALELLEANVAAAKAKGKGRLGRKGKKDAWLIPPEMPKARRTSSGSCRSRCASGASTARSRP